MYIHDLALKCTTEVARGSDHPAPRVLESIWSWVNIPTKYIDSLESIILARLSNSILNLVDQ
jgi:hypothetical protein